MQFITKLDKQKKENKKIFKTKWIYRFFIYSFFCWLTENNYAKKHNVRDGKFTHVVYYTPLFTNESDSESKKCNFVYTFSISKKKKILDDPLQPTVFRNSLESTKKWCSKRSLEKKYRMTVETFEEILNMISWALRCDDTNVRRAVPVGKRLAIFLWRSATDN